MQNSGKRLAVLVRARNEAEHLPRLIEGLSKQSVEPDEIVLVDSGSTDSTIRIAHSAGWKIVSLDPNEFSFGRSLNKGFEHCTSDVVVIVSAHVFPTRSDFLAVISGRVEANSKTIAYGKQIGDNRTKFSEKVLMSTWFPSERIIDQGHAFMNNANACVPRGLWERLRYDETLPGLEDIDFSMRVIALGGEVVYEDEAEIVHVHDETYSQISQRYRREAAAYKIIFPGEGMAWFSAVVLAVRNIRRDMVEALREGLLGRVWSSIVLFRVSQFYGAWRGFRQAGSRDSALMMHMYHPLSKNRTLSGKGSPQKIEYISND